MKKNRLFMLGIVTVFVAVLSLTLVSSTFAKYTSTVAGQDSAKVAKWGWTFSGDVEGTQASLSKVDLWKTSVYELTDNGNGNVDTENPVDADVVQGTTKPNIAPGTGGMAEFTITNASEVSASWSVSYASDEKGVNLEWSLDNSNWSTNITDCNRNGTINVADPNKVVTITLYWRWVFDGPNTDDTDDTTNGVNEVEPTVDVTVVMTQIN